MAAAVHCALCHSGALLKQLKRKNKKLIFVKEPALNLLFLYQAHRMLYVLNQQQKNLLAVQFSAPFFA